MKAIRYTDPMRFSERTQRFLERNEAVNNLILGITQNLVEKGYQDLEPYMATVEDEETLFLVALQTPPNKLIIYGEGDLPNEAFESLASSLLQERGRLPGVVGPFEIAKRFRGIWQSKTDCKSKISMNLRVHVLTEVRYASQITGRSRLATEEDIATLGEWFRIFALPLNENPSLKEATKQAKAKIERGEVYVWEDGGLVSMAAKGRHLRNGVTIGMVYTPLEHRRRGYATANVAALSKEILESGYTFCSLFTDLANPTSNSIYRKVGYKPVCDYVDYDFLTGQT